MRGHLHIWNKINVTKKLFYFTFILFYFSVSAHLQWNNTHTQPFNGPLSATTLVSRYQKGTRSSAITEGPRDASYQLNSLPRNSAETTCTTSPEQIKVMKLEGYSGTMCNKHVHSTMTRSSHLHRPIGVINKPTTEELWISPVYQRLAVAKFSKSTM